MIRIHRVMKSREKKRIILYLLAAHVFQTRKTTGKRLRVAYFIPFVGQVCREIFLVAFCISDWILRECLKLLKQKCLVVPQHKNTGNTVPLKQAVHDNVAAFLLRIMAQFGETDTKRVSTRHQENGNVTTELSKRDIVFLPCSFSIEKLLELYHHECQDEGLRTSRRSFRRIWLQHERLKNMIIRSPSKDECDFCVAHCCMRTQGIQKEMNTNTAEFDKALDLWTQHRDEYRAMRKLYEQYIARAKDCAERKDGSFVCISFDFAQSAAIPYAPQQPGPFFFFSPFKIYHFGICDEGSDIQYHMCYGEDQFGKGANHVVSMVHYYISTIRWRMAEDASVVMPKEMIFWADNCSGQNKNRTMIQYLTWLVQQPNGPETILLNFQIKGHTRNTVDRHFGDVKKLYYRSNVWLPQEYIDVIAKCTKTGNNVPVNLFDKSHVFGNWTEKFDTSFNGLKGITNYQIFKFERGEPGKCFVKMNPADQWTMKELFKSAQSTMPDASFPTALTPCGLKPEKRVLFHNSYTPHIPLHRPELKDLFYYPKASKEELEAANQAGKQRGKNKKSLDKFASVESAQAVRQEELDATRVSSASPQEESQQQNDTAVVVAPQPSDALVHLMPIGGIRLTRTDAFNTLPAENVGQKRKYNKSAKQIAKEAAAKDAAVAAKRAKEAESEALGPVPKRRKKIADKASTSSAEAENQEPNAALQTTSQGPFTSSVRIMYGLLNDIIGDISSTVLNTQQGIAGVSAANGPLSVRTVLGNITNQ